MKKSTSTKIILFCLLFFAVNLGIKAQTNGRAPLYHVINPDSLKGFDENAAKQGAFDVGAYGDEFKAYMYSAQRRFIDNKYKIVHPAAKEFFSPVIPMNNAAKGNPGNPVIAVAGCNNEDFENFSATFAIPNTVNISTPLAIPGWTAQGASNYPAGPNDNCLNPYVYSNPTFMNVIAPGPGGLTDAIIGSSYKIYSVFGTSTTNVTPAASYDAFNHYGDWFVKLNDGVAGSSVNRIIKTFPVTSSNALFQFAFISLLEGSHSCCDAGGFSLKVKIGCGPAAPTVTSCPQFTAAAQAGCTSPGNSTAYLVSPINSTWKYNKWKLNTLDLTSFIGNCVTIEVTAFDCTYTGHAGYVYFDAQCSPMDIGGNTSIYPAGTPSINLPTCGAGSTATITAPPVTGGYTWTCPGSFTAVPPTGTLTTNQQIITGTTGNHTLTMNPPGSCSPIIRIINVIIAPAPNLILPNQTNYTCANPTSNGVTVQMSSGTATNNLSIPNYTVSFSPTAPTGTTGVTANTATYTGLAVGINTITIMDSVGCTATQTINVTPAVAVPTFTFDTPSGTVLGCNPPYLPITAVNTSTDPLLSSSVFSYTWTSASSTSVTTTYNINQVGTYTVSGMTTYTTSSGTVASCITTSLITITGSTLVPSTNVSPATQALTCNGSCKTFTATCPTGTANIIGVWYASTGPVVGPTGTPMLICANAPGTYTAQFCSTISGCCSQQTVSVTSNTQVPTLTVTPTTFNGFTINCTNPKVGVDVNTNSITGPFGYTWTPLPTPPGSPTSPLTGGYTMTIPGQYEIKFVDGFSCTVSSTVNIYIDTLRPSPLSMTNLPSNSYTINCYKPNLIATALTNPLLPPTSYSWTQPSPLITYPSNTINIGMVNVTNSVTGVTYTVLAIGPNGCVGKAKVQFYKDIAMPTYNPAYTPSIGITCGNTCVAITPTPSTGPPINFTVTSPPPTQTATTAGALMCVPGPYTMVYQNIANGCLKTGTVNVPQNVIPPGLNPPPTYYFPCGQTTTTISANTVTTSNTYSYTWTGPEGSGMSCLGGTACATPSVNMPGVYVVTILNTQNGCVSTNTMLVVDNGGNISVGFTADPTEGFSPLSVGFNNTSALGSTTAGSVTTLWNYGNGITYTTTGSSASYTANGLPDGSTIFQSAGSYTVTLLVTQVNGTLTCSGTATAVIKVELPSKIEVPNVFTPNGDNVNDVFMLQTTNLTEIKCTIFDRWGVKMYDVTAEKGNIEWDGKNFSKKDVPAGTYFYLLTAKGKDLKDYEQKGTISLYR